ncbi:General negative regulator of transcription subunit 3 [Vanrija pseudolonga]|uniref:General negative regulator of transcription subunit n=1 Tax=Vanrija pseudolonga TaxID=143232 RepID=A0AAF0YAY5_9TREE|nr:General negative regulator of transcription subunit 3 [Vanrija pseudolonga]
MALRKLQTEIDRTLKAVAQGVETFEATFDKLNHASNSTQKDKLETDLKTQIKKLQRMRDQIKVWLGSSDIKDKSALLDNRKLIETQMERFKALEKEMKMKAFSKEGLIAAARLDPAEKAKRDMVDWIGNTIDELSRQIEQTEAEAEQLQVTGKKKKAAGDRLSELEQLNERRQWHIGRLEIVQRVFENGQINVDQVESIQEDVKYFVEANTEEDFDFDLGIYDELNLQEAEDEYGAADYGHNAEDSSNIDSASVADESTKTPSKEERKSSKASSVPPVDDTPPSPVQSKRGSTKKTVAEKAAEKAEAKAAKAAAEAQAAAAATAPPPQTTSVPTPTKPAPLPPIRYAAAAAAAVGGAAAVAPAASTHAESVASSYLSKDSPHDDDQGYEGEEEEAHEVASVPEQQASNGYAPPPPPGISDSPSPPPQDGASATNGPLGQQQPYAHAESSRAAAASYNSSPRKEQGVLENLMQSFGVAKDMAERRANDPNGLHAALDVSFHNAPTQLDGEPPRYYHPQNPITTPSYYPQVRLPALEEKSIYQRLDLDQLFYIFYYMTGTYEQWLAAQELKRQSWRFHKQYLTWFQRAHNPQAITEDYEQGGYYYFDWENSWCQRRKSDFRFEYRWLSDH